MKIKVEKLSHAKRFLHELQNGRPTDHHARLNHAQNVNRVYEKVLTELLKVADDDSIALHLRRNMAGVANETNTCDFTVGNGARAYTLGYSAGSITIKVGSKFGSVRDVIDNTTSFAKIEAIFASL